MVRVLGETALASGATPVLFPMLEGLRDCIPVLLPTALASGAVPVLFPTPEGLRDGVAVLLPTAVASGLTVLERVDDAVLGATPL